MDGTLGDGWEGELGRWLGPFLARLGRKEQRRWAPFYLKGLILPGERKSVEPMAARVAPGDLQQLHHFVSTSPWATAPLEDELVKAADRLVGGPEAVLVVDDTALVKQGRHSVGVKRQYCGQLGKKANCQSLVSLTLARAEVPVGVGLRLFLPEDWCADAARRAAAGVPEAVGYRPKWKIALDEIDRVLASGARFGCGAGRRRVRQGGRVPGRAGRTAARLRGRHPADAEGLPGRRDPRLSRAQGGPAARASTRCPRPRASGAAELVESRPAAFRAVSWRTGTKGPLRGGVRRHAGAGRRRAGRRTRPAPARRGGVAGRRAPGQRREEVLPLEPPARCHARAAGGADQGAVGVRAAAPAAQGRAGARPLRGPELARAAPPRAPVPARLRLPAAPAARGEKGPGPRPSPDRRPAPSLPAVRRRIVAALTRVLLCCPHCRRRFEHHLRL